MRAAKDCGMRVAHRLVPLFLILSSSAWAASGTLDTAFGPDHVGKVVTLVPGQDVANSVLVQADLGIDRHLACRVIETTAPAS